MRQWQDTVGHGWVFGMGAVFGLAAALIKCILVWTGDVVRDRNITGKIAATEDDVNSRWWTASLSRVFQCKLLLDNSRTDIARRLAGVPNE